MSGRRGTRTSGIPSEIEGIEPLGEAIDLLIGMDRTERDAKPTRSRRHRGGTDGGNQQAVIEKSSRSFDSGALATTADPLYIVRWDNLNTLRSVGGSLAFTLRPVEGLTLGGSFVVTDTRNNEQPVPLVPLAPLAPLAPLGLPVLLLPDGTLLALPAGILNWKTPTPEGWGWLALIGVIAFLQQVLVAKAIAKVPFMVLIPLNFLQLIFATILSYAVYSKLIDSWTLAGALVILAGTLYNAYRNHTRAGKEAIQAGVV